MAKSSGEVFFKHGQIKGCFYFIEQDVRLHRGCFYNLSVSVPAGLIRVSDNAVTETI